MRNGKFAAEQIVGLIKQAEAEMAVADLSSQHGFSPATFYQWRAKRGRQKAADAMRLKALEGENGWLKKLLIEAHLDIKALKIAFGVNTTPHA